MIHTIKSQNIIERHFAYVRHNETENFLAVDFDNMVIHAEVYTWDEWATEGRRNYPTCQPMAVEFVQMNPFAFFDFTDMR